MKFVSDRFEERRQAIIDDGKADYVDMVEFYTMKNVFYLPEKSRWSTIVKQAKQNDIAVRIDSALHAVEKNNPSLKGALPDNYFSRMGIDVAKLAALIDSINNIDTIADSEEDVVGRVYEYFLGKFAATEGKGGGEFYTPKCVVNLIAEMIEPYSGKIYDPCCGSGGMFVQSVTTKITCPDKTVAKREFWPRVRNELFAAEWDLLLCSAGSLSAVICEAARQRGRKAIDVGQLDQNLAQGHDFG